MKKYLKCSETAVMIRQELKQNFPAVKFSVVSNVYAGGASIRVRYDAQVPERKVWEATRKFAGSGFDAMTDYQYPKGPIEVVDGVEIYSGADYVFVRNEDLDFENEYRNRPVDIDEMENK